MNRAIVPGIALLALGLFEGANNLASPHGTELAPGEAATIVGGACGKDYSWSSINCDDEVQRCGGEDQNCNTQSVESYVSQGDGERKKKDTSTYNCMICGSTSCNAVTKITSHEPAACDAG